LAAGDREGWLAKSQWRGKSAALAAASIEDEYTDEYIAWTFVAEPLSDESASSEPLEN
jgi:hypothetical protein